VYVPIYAMSEQRIQIMSYKNKFLNICNIFKESKRDYVNIFAQNVNKFTCRRTRFEHCKFTDDFNVSDNCQVKIKYVYLLISFKTVIRILYLT